MTQKKFTVEELINKLSFYPKDCVVYANTIFKNGLGEIVIEFQKSEEEMRREDEEWNRKHQEMMDKRGEITCFGNRW